MKISKIIFLCLLLVGCKTGEDSELKHKWGETRRDLDIFKHRECEKTKKTSLPKTQNLIEKLGHHIMRSNPSTFVKGSVFDPGFFCFSVRKSYMIQALAFMKKRAVELTTALINEVASVNELAYAISHELAHITLAHANIAHPNYLPSEKYKKLRADLILLTQSDTSQKITIAYDSLQKCLRSTPNFEDYKAVYRDSLKIIARMQCQKQENDTSTCGKGIEISELRQLFSHSLPKTCETEAYTFFDAHVANSEWQRQVQFLDYKTLIAEMAEEVKKDQNNSEYTTNDWREIEADDVGMEFYFRSGFDKEAVLNFRSIFAHMELSKSSKYTVDDCVNFAKLKSIEELKEVLHSKVERVSETHPLPCWRLIHLAYEKQLHKEEIGNLPLEIDVSEFHKMWLEAKKELEAARWRY